MATEAPKDKDRTNPFIAKSMGKGDKGSRKKTEIASEQANEEVAVVEREQKDWPKGADGTPMVKAEMAASELVPTGQYANVTIGPCRLHFYIDPDRELADGESYFSDQQRATIAKALNEAAEMVEADVVAVQRSLVLESIQQQIGEG